MSWLLTSPELWGVLGLTLIAFVLTTGKQGNKKTNARLARVIEKATDHPLQETQFLRRQNATQTGPLAKLAARLETAGMTITPQRYIVISAAIAFGIFALAALLSGKLLLAILLGLMCGLGLPHMAVARKLRKRQRSFLNLFPDAIDLMVRGLRAGLPIAESFINVSRELPAPVGDTFANISQSIQLGVPFEKALGDMSAKLQITEFDFFVTSVILQRETGGNLSEILTTLSDTLRQRYMMKVKIHALSSEARASAYIVGALPFVVFGLLMVISPKYLTPLFTDYRGNLSLGGAMLSMTLGALTMRRMTQMEI